jgi:hypothetical protein
LIAGKGFRPDDAEAAKPKEVPAHAPFDGAEPVYAVTPRLAPDPAAVLAARTADTAPLNQKSEAGVQEVPQSLSVEQERAVMRARRAARGRVFRKVMNAYET